MKAFFILFLIFYSTATFSQPTDYSKQEKQIEDCYKKWFSESTTEIKELNEIFEGYFLENRIISIADSTHQQYLKILRFIEKDKAFEPFYDYKKVLKISSQLGLTKENIKWSDQLDCFTDIYIANKVNVDTTTSFYVYGASFEFMKQQPDISPYIVAGALLNLMDYSDLRKSLYQNTIVLLFIFNFAYSFEDLIQEKKGINFFSTTCGSDSSGSCAA